MGQNSNQISLFFVKCNYLSLGQNTTTMNIPLNIFPPVQIAYFIFLAAVLGACVGSFVNCLAWRMVQGQSVLRGRSQCTQCGHTLGVFDLVPILSWIGLRGKCRYCKAAVSPRYVIVEILEALLFVAIVWQYGLSIQTLAYLLLVAILTGLALVDLDTSLIPNGFILAGIVVWLGTVWFIEPPQVSFGVGSLFLGLSETGFLAVLVDGLVGGFAIGAFMLLMSLIFEKITGRASLGGGDIKLFFMIGLYVGVFGSLLNLLLSCVFGLLFSFVWSKSNAAEKQVVWQKEAKHEEGEAVAGAKEASPHEENEGFKTKPFPFGPAIAASTVVTLLVGFTFITWYVDLIIF